MKKKRIINLFSYLYIDKYLKHYAIIFSLIVMISFLFPRGKVLKYAYQINDIEALDVDTEEDFLISDSVYKRNNNC